MAITLGTPTLQASSGAPNPMSVTVASGDDRVLFFEFTCRRNNLLSATYGGVTMTNIWSVNIPVINANAQVHSSGWMLKNPPIGTADIAGFTNDGDVLVRNAMAAVVLYGVDQTITHRTPSTAQHTIDANAVSASVSPVAEADDLVIGGVIAGGTVAPGTIVAGSGQTVWVNNLASAPSVFHSSYRAGVSPSVTLAYTWDSGVRYAIGGVAFIPAGGGGSVVVTRTVDVDALLQKQRTITSDINAQLTKTFAITLDVNAVLQRGYVLLTEIDALLQKVRSAVVTMDGMLQRKQELTAELNALLNKTQNVVTTIDAVLFEVGVTAITVEVDALLHKLRGIVVTSDALLRKNLSSQTTVDSILQIRSIITTLVNVVLQKTRLTTLTVDSVLFDADAGGFQGVVGGFNLPQGRIDLSQPRVNFAAARSVSFGASRSFILDNPRGFRRSL